MTSAIPVQRSTNNELSSQLGAGHSVSSIYTHLGDEMIVNIYSLYSLSNKNVFDDIVSS